MAKKTLSLKDKLKKLLERDIPARHVARLRNYSGIAEDAGQGGQADLPDEVIESYWKWKILRDRGGDASELLEYEFISICMFAGQAEADFIKDADFKPAGIVELFQSGKLKKNDPVEFRFRSRNWIPGLIRGVAGGGTQLIVVAAGDTQQRTVDQKDVRLPLETRNQLVAETTEVDDDEIDDI